MDPTKRMRERQSKLSIGSPLLFARVLVAGVCIFFGIACSVGGDISTVIEAWRWRNAIGVNAEIVKHEFRPIRQQNDEPFLELGGDHQIRYRFVAKFREVTGDFETFSMDPNSITPLERKYPVGEGETIPVFYLPDDPEQHIPFVNPAITFQTSAKRLAWVTMILLTGVLIVVAVVVFYRPKKTERLFMPEKIDIPKDIELKPPEPI